MAEDRLDFQCPQCRRQCKGAVESRALNSAIARGVKSGSVENNGYDGRLAAEGRRRRRQRRTRAWADYVKPALTVGAGVVAVLAVVIARAQRR